MTKLNLLGKRFNKLVVVQETPLRKNNNIVWECQCDCGNKKLTTTTYLTTGHTTSCGCLGMEKRIERAKKGICKSIAGVATLNAIYYGYKKGAKNRNLSFNLQKEDFKKLIYQNCYYCGDKPYKTYRHAACNGGITYNGIDRIDSSKGYSLDNCVTCCHKCNTAKSNLSLDEFFKLITKIYENRIRL